MVLLACSELVWGSEASLRVTVLDPTGARVVKASMQLLFPGRKMRKAIARSAGEYVFEGLTEGPADLRVEAVGFESYSRKVQLKPGDNELEITLALETVRERVEVQDDTNRLKAGGGASLLLTPSQIQNLPDDPEEMKRTLELMAGPGTVFRVDGFVTQRLPSKSLIASIRIRLSPYAAEDHDLGFSSIDIQTKPGMGAWHGTAAFDYGSADLDARNFFAAAKSPDQYRHARGDISGPLRAGSSSISAWWAKGFSYDSGVSVGTLPGGPFAYVVPLPMDDQREGARLLQLFGTHHVVAVQFEHTTYTHGTLGQFDLPERLTLAEQKGNELRVSDAATISPNTLNELRLQTAWTSEGSRATSDAPALIVNGAFAEGGGPINKWLDKAAAMFTEDLHHKWHEQELSLGAEVDYEQDRNHDLSNANGMFVFSSLSSYLSNEPSLYAKLLGDTAASWQQWEFGAYAQDELRLGKKASLSIGVRWESQTHVERLFNVAPRAGFAWSPFDRSPLTVRAGFGVFYAWIPSAAFGETLQFNGMNQNTLQILNPGFPDPTSGSGSTILSTMLYLHDPHLRPPMILRGSIGVQRPLGKLRILTDLRWERGEQLAWLNEVNQPGQDGSRPYPQLGNVFELQNGADSLRTEWFTVLSGDAHRLSFGASYSLSLEKNEVDNIWAPPANSLDLRGDWAYGSGDARNRVWGYFILHAPVGFRVSLNSSYASALPFNVTTGTDEVGDAFFNSRPPGVPRNSMRGDGIYDTDVRVSWTHEFGKEIASSGRVIQPHDAGGRGGTAFDMPRHAYQMKLYCEATNIFNQPGFTSFDGVLTSPTFGQPTAAAPGRRIQFGVALMF